MTEPFPWIIPFGHVLNFAFQCVGIAVTCGLAYLGYRLTFPQPFSKE